MLEPKVIHFSGHVKETLDVFKFLSGSSATTYEGTVKNIASSILAEQRRRGYEVDSRITWAMDGDIREVHAIITGGIGVNMWHVFTTVSDRWPMLQEEGVRLYG